jgi:hypothetical protein
VGTPDRTSGFSFAHALVGEEVELEGVRARLVRVVMDLGLGWIELARASSR